MKDRSSEENGTQPNPNKNIKVMVGLDIGTTKIACFVGRRNEHGKIQILSMGKAESTGVMRGVVSNINEPFNP